MNEFQRFQEILQLLKNPFTHNDAETQYSQILSENPFLVVQFHFQNIFLGNASPTSRDSLIYLGSIIMSKCSFLISLDNPDFSTFILSQIPNLICQTSEKNMETIAIIIHKCAARLLDLDFWPDFSSFLFQSCLSDNPMISATGFLCLSQCLSDETITPDNEPFLEQYLSDLCSSIISTPDPIRLKPFLRVIYIAYDGYSLPSIIDYVEEIPNLIPKLLQENPILLRSCLNDMCNFIDDYPSVFNDFSIQFTELLIPLFSNNTFPDDLRKYGLDLYSSIISCNVDEFTDLISNIVTPVAILSIELEPNYNPFDEEFDDTPRKRAEESLSLLADAFEGSEEYSHFIADMALDFIKKTEIPYRRTAFMLMKQSIESNPDLFIILLNSDDRFPEYFAIGFQDVPIVRYESYKAFRKCVKVCQTDLDCSTMIPVLLGQFSKEEEQHMKEVALHALVALCDYNTIDSQFYGVLMELSSTLLHDENTSIKAASYAIKIIRSIINHSGVQFFEIAPQILGFLMVKVSEGPKANGKLFYECFLAATSMYRCLSQDQYFAVAETVFQIITQVDFSELTTNEMNKMTKAIILCIDNAIPVFRVYFQHVFDFISSIVNENLTTYTFSLEDDHDDVSEDYQFIEIDTESNVKKGYQSSDIYEIQYGYFILNALIRNIPNLMDIIQPFCEPIYNLFKNTLKRIHVDLITKASLMALSKFLNTLVHFGPTVYLHLFIEIQQLLISDTGISKHSSDPETLSYVIKILSFIVNYYPHEETMTPFIGEIINFLDEALKNSIKREKKYNDPKFANRSEPSHEKYLLQNGILLLLRNLYTHFPEHSSSYFLSSFSKQYPLTPNSKYPDSLVIMWADFMALSPGVHDASEFFQQLQLLYQPDSLISLSDIIGAASILTISGKVPLDCVGKFFTFLNGLKNDSESQRSYLYFYFSSLYLSFYDSIDNQSILQAIVNVGNVTIQRSSIYDFWIQKLIITCLSKHPQVFQNVELLKIFFPIIDLLLHDDPSQLQPILIDFLEKYKSISFTK